MRTTQILTLTSVKRKKSVQGNIYCECEFQEVVKDIDYEFDMPIQVWKHVYFPQEMTAEEAKQLEGKKVTAVLTFYPVKRKHQNREYTDIRLIMLSCDVLEEVVEEGSR